MFPIDLLWVYLGVPAILVSILVLIKLKQRKRSEIIENEFADEGQEEALLEKDVKRGGQVKVRETQIKPEASEAAKPQNCPNYLGYLYMKGAPDRTHIPTECYNCPKLLQCLYSPNVIQRVYGQ